MNHAPAMTVIPNRNVNEIEIFWKNNPSKEESSSRNEERNIEIKANSDIGILNHYEQKADELKRIEGPRWFGKSFHGEFCTLRKDPSFFRLRRNRNELFS